MKKWNSSGSSATEVAVFEDGLNGAPPASQLEEIRGEQESPISSNGNSDPNIEVEPESGSSKPSTPTKQVNLKYLSS